MRRKEIFIKTEKQFVSLKKIIELFIGMREQTAHSNDVM